MQMLRWLKVCLLLVVAVPIFAVVIWHLLLFLPHLGELEGISSRGTESVQNVEVALYPLVIASESKAGVRSYAARQSYYSLVYSKSAGRPWSWHLSNLLWYSAIYVHFDEKAVFGIWAQCALTTCEHGLAEIAQQHFGKQLDSFSKNELAALVAFLRSPSSFALGTQANEQRATKILEKAKNLSRP